MRTWEFMPVIGRRASLLGNESGRMEAWVYPLKILRDFNLKFHTEGRALPADSLARTLIVRPESSTIVYAGDAFVVRETFFVPVNEPGAIILIDVETEKPLEIEATFHRDFQLEWPGSMGGTFLDWIAGQHAFFFGEEQKKFAAFVGSPTAADPRLEYQTNYSEVHESSLRLGVTTKGKDTKIIVMAASVEGRVPAEKTYQHILTAYPELLRESAQYYQDHLRQTVNLVLPDRQLQQAYDWARVSLLQGVVDNPYLGSGLVAGYRTSGQSQRPGFAWFFGRDSMWTAFALTSEGDFAATRAAIAFISKFQRNDGKIPHEISQSASFVPWFTAYPYPYASADSTPLFIIAMNDYVAASGDVAFAKQQWNNLWKAFEFLRSTYEEHGFPKNFGVGHGWVEGGPLLPIKTEFYQTGLGTEALRALANLAHLTGKEEARTELMKTFEHQKKLVNDSFWIAEKKRFAFGLDNDNHPVDEPSVLATVPMWFGLLEPSKADSMVTQIADLDHQTDWGMRIISERSPKFSGGGYHFGSVWPLFTGWGSVGEYRYHRAQPAYNNLRANALLTLDGSLGHTTEVLSGDYYQSLSTSSPHQIWSAAMVVSPLLRGMFGLEADATKSSVTFSPHVPADWTSFAIQNVRAGPVELAMRYNKTLDGITLEIKREGSGDCTFEFSPAVSLGAKVLGVEVNGRPAQYRVIASSSDQHVLARFTVSGGPTTVRIRLQNDFGISYSVNLPPLGSNSQGLRILSETWTAARDRLTINVGGRSGNAYELSIWNPTQIGSIEGAELVKASSGETKIRLQLPSNGSEMISHQAFTLHFLNERSERHGK